MDEFPGLGRQVVAVVAGDLRGVDPVRHPGHLVPVELDPGAHDKPVVTDPAAAVGADGLLVGVDVLGTLPYPRHTLRHDGAFRPGALLDRGTSAADKCPQRLVVVGGCRGEEPDVVEAGLLQAGGEGDACGPPADDEYLVVRGDGHGGSLLVCWAE